jgi:hypothetical protein
MLISGVSSAISVTCFKSALNKTDEANTSKTLYSLGHSYEKILDTRLRLDTTDGKLF